MTATDSRVSQLQREVQALQRKIAEESSKVAKARDRAIRARDELARSSAATRQSKQRASEAAEKDAQKAEARRSEHETQLATKTGDLYKAQQRQMDERMKAQERQADERMKAQQAALKKLADEARRRDAQPLVQQLGRRSPQGPVLAPTNLAAPTPDLFIAHASEDKDEVARPLAEHLRSLDLQVWYDEFELQIGDNLRRKIDHGLATCRFGVTILSPHFFAKEWPRWELDGLAARHLAGGGDIILPVWHRISKDEVLAQSPPLANLVALKTADYRITEIAERIAEVVRG
jgi:hypothetical protein